MKDEEFEAARLRAYQIWEQEGRQEGQHESHWQQALKELGLLPAFGENDESVAEQTRRWDESQEWE